MSKRSATLRALVTEKLTAAAEEIFALVERTIAEYEEELSRCREENLRNQQLLEENLRNQQLLEENLRNQQLLEENLEALSPHRGDKTEEEEEEGLSLKQESVEDPCPQWGAQHLENPKPVPEINSEATEHAHPAEHENSSSDGHNTDEEPPLNEDIQEDFFEQSQLGGLEGNGGARPKPSRPPKQCAVCGKVFGDLKRHMVVHTGEKPYSCSLCGRRFTRKGSMQSHMAIHRGDAPFRCPVCGKMFSQRGHMQTHALTHSGEKPFGCSVCSARFSSRALLLRHRRVHTGVRPFSCPFCDRGFTRNEHLRRHVQTHAGPLSSGTDARDHSGALVTSAAPSAT